MKSKPFHDLNKTVIKGLVGLYFGEFLHAYEDLRSAEQEWKNEKNKETGSIRRELKKNLVFSNHEDGNREGKGEEGFAKLFIPEVYSVATCTSSKKNVIRCVRYVAWKPNDSGRVRSMNKQPQRLKCTWAAGPTVPPLIDLAVRCAAQATLGLSGFPSKHL